MGLVQDEWVGVFGHVYGLAPGLYYNIGWMERIVLIVSHTCESRNKVKYDSSVHMSVFGVAGMS